MAELFNPDQLHLEHLSLAEAKSKAIEMLKGTNTKATKLGNLIRDIERAPSSREVQRILVAEVTQVSRRVTLLSLRSPLAKAGARKKLQKKFFFWPRWVDIYPDYDKIYL